MKSIKTKGMAFISSILLIVLLIMLLVTNTLIRDWTTNELKSNIKKTSITVEHMTEKYIDQYLRPIKELSRTPEIQSMNWRQQKQLISQQSTLEYLALAIVNPEGFAYYTDGSILDLSDREYIKNALNGEFNISPVIISRATEEQVMMIAQPIYNDALVVGVIIARIKPKFMTDFMKSENMELYSIYFALDEKGNVMLHSDEKYPLEKFNFLDFQEDNYGMKGIKEVLLESYDSPSGFGSYTKDEEKVIIGYSTINMLNWRFYLGFYEKDILESIRQLDFIFLMIGSILVVIAVIIAWFITKAFTDPVIELSCLFKRAAGGELTVRSTYNKADELGEASRSFNQMMDQIRTLTYFDPFTGLPNKQVFTSDLKENISTQKQEMYIMIIEIRNFSKVNEMFGYQTGDHILKKTSEKIDGIMVKSDTLYRGKGSQFIALFSKKETIKEVILIADEIIKAIRRPIITGKEEISLTGIIGISQFPKDGKDVETLLKKAVFASNHLKKKETLNIEVFEEALYDKDLEIRVLVKKIDEALDHNEMYLKYQPIYNLEKMSIAGAEALIRWEDPVLGIISPGEFIPIAEKNGLIQKLDYWVIKRVFKQINAWKTQGLSLITVSINISSETFEDDAFESWINNQALKHSIDTEIIQLELTERIILKDINESIEKFKRLRKNGFKIAIDDFGVGYSSLSYLVKLPIDHLKIDGSFIRNMRNGNESKVIVSTLVNMARELDVIVVAEGIESQDEVDYLLNISCQKGQGFYLDMPLDPKDMGKKLKLK